MFSSERRKSLFGISVFVMRKNLFHVCRVRAYQIHSFHRSRPLLPQPVLDHRDSLWVRLVHSDIVRVGTLSVRERRGATKNDPSPIKSEFSFNAFLFLISVQWESKWFLYHILLVLAAGTLSLSVRERRGATKMTPLL